MVIKNLETSSTYVPTRFVKSLLRLAGKRQFDIQQILLNADLDFNPLDENTPEHISAIQYSRVYQQVVMLLQDDSFGMLPGKSVSPGAFRMMCYAIIHCGTLHSAIKRLCAFFEVFYDKELCLVLQVKGETATISYPQFKPAKQPKWQAGEAYALALWHRFFSWLIAMPIEVKGVRLASEPSGSTTGYQRLFGVPTEFACKPNGLDFHSHYLEMPIAQTESSLKDFLRTAPYQMMVEPEQANSSELVAKVRRIMGYDLSKGFPSFEEVAEKLHMSPPTLRRHLRKDGVSYQGLKDQVRQDAAVAYLSRPELSISAVSALMGFTDPSAFHRSFRKWTGLTPGQFREQEFSIDKSGE